jgi:hypothetical protein
MVTLGGHVVEAVRHGDGVGRVIVDYPAARSILVRLVSLVKTGGRRNSHHCQKGTNAESTLDICVQFNSLV